MKYGKRAILALAAGAMLVAFAACGPVGGTGSPGGAGGADAPESGTTLTFEAHVYQQDIDEDGESEGPEVEIPGRASNLNLAVFDITGRPGLMTGDDGSQGPVQNLNLIAPFRGTVTCMPGVVTLQAVLTINTKLGDYVIFTVTRADGSPATFTRASDGSPGSDVAAQASTQSIDSVTVLSATVVCVG